MDDLMKKYEELRKRIHVVIEVNKPIYSRCIDEFDILEMAEEDFGTAFYDFLLSLQEE